MIIEGTERTLADIAVDTIIDRTLPDASMRDLNLERLRAVELDGMSKVADAVGAMPFLAERRLVVVTDTQALKVAARRELWAVAESVPDGNTLVLCDLLSPRSQRPEPFGAMAGRTALRIDTTLNEAMRTRFVQELLQKLDATAEPRVIAELSSSQAELSAIRNDLEKLALLKKKITYKDLEQDSLSVEDPKAYKYASALVEGRLAEALEIAADLFTSDPRGAGVPLVSALATEFGLIWELARPGGELPPRAKWRERGLRPVAARIGERRARVAYERAVRGFEALVTGKIDEPRLLVEMLTAELGAVRGGT
ncbi:MAG: DNA polymerase III subunit delta [Candidatus Baltobacteraceae bacterium]